MNASNFMMAASVSMQLADQLPRELWPQLIAAESLLLNQRIAPGIKYIDRALKIDPRSITGLITKARLCMHSGNHTAAIKLVDTAIALTPDNSKLFSFKGELLVDAGDIDAARDSFRQSVEIAADNADGLLGLAQLPGDNFSDTLLETTESVTASQQLRPDDQIKVHFALAHAFDKKGNIAKHFEHLNAGNNLKNQSLNHDPKESKKATRGIVKYFPKRLFARFRDVAGNPARIIFIVGFPRCGSTLVEQILSSHPSVSAAGEVYALRHAVLEYQLSKHLAPDFPAWVKKQNAAAFGEIANDYVKKVERFNKSAYLTDKMLENYKFVGMIHLLFPNATIINVERNPIDVCYSNYKRLFHRNYVPYAYSLDNLAAQYRDYRKTLKHWNKVLPGRVHTVEYEQLVNRQEDATRDLLTRCELPWNDACLSFHENARAVLTSSNTQVRQPLYSSSIDRWKAYEQYLGPLLKLRND